MEHDLHGMPRLLYGRAERGACPAGDRVEGPTHIGIERHSAPEDAIHEQRAVRSVDRRQALQAGGCLDVVDAERAVRRVVRLRVAGLSRWRLVVRLAPAGQHVRIVDALLEHRVLLDHAAAPRADER